MVERAQVVWLLSVEQEIATKQSQGNNVTTMFDFITRRCRFQSVTGVDTVGVATVKIFESCANLSDQRERSSAFRAAARFGWRPCRLVV